MARRSSKTRQVNAGKSRSRSNQPGSDSQVAIAKTPEKARSGSRPGGRSERSDSSKGRLVRNHSTNLPGLIAVLERLCHCPGVDTLTPAVIGRARSHAPHFRLKVSVPIQGGYKLIARQGKSFQEVFVTTHLDKVDLEDAIQASLP